MPDVPLGGQTGAGGATCLPIRRPRRTGCGFADTAYCFVHGCLEEVRACMYACVYG